MEKVRLGKTGLYVTKTAMGCLPIQRKNMEEAILVLRKAYENGINYFDTANAYTDSEKKIGEALHDVRDRIVISTKSSSLTYQGVLDHIENSLKMLQTDYIDIFQFHNPATMPDPNDPNGSYQGALEAKRRGWIRHIGITNHRLQLAKDAVKSGLFETIQYPFSYISNDAEIELLNMCKEYDLGFIGMKGLCGGMLSNAAVCYAYAQQFDNLVPIWGIQHEWELDQWLQLTKNNQQMTDELQAVINKDRAELTGNFCRSCGYCLPCPADIDIPNAARMAMLLRRSPYQPYMTEEYHEKMHRIENCLHCNHCKNHCPYGLDTPELLKYMLKDYDEFYAIHHNEAK